MAIQQTLDAVYEDGVLKPLEALDLEEHQRVRITVATAAEPANRGGEAAVQDSVLTGWLDVYAGLTTEEVAEVERIALNRSRFMRAPR